MGSISLPSWSGHTPREGAFRDSRVGRRARRRSSAVSCPSKLRRDSLQISLQFVEPPWAGLEIAQNQQLPLAADEGDCSGHGAGGQFFFCFHGITPPRTS